MKNGVLGRGFSRTRRAGAEEHSVRLTCKLFDLKLVFFQEAELAKADVDARFIEDSHDDLFAERRGDRADAKVEVFALVPDLDTAVLRNTPLGDVHVRHDFQAADEEIGRASCRERV